MTELFTILDGFFINDFIDPQYNMNNLIVQNNQ